MVLFGSSFGLSLKMVRQRGKGLERRAMRGKALRNKDMARETVERDDSGGFTLPVALRM